MTPLVIALFVIGFLFILVSFSLARPKPKQLQKLQKQAQLAKLEQENKAARPSPSPRTNPSETTDGKPNDEKSVEKAPNKERQNLSKSMIVAPTTASSAGAPLRAS